MTGQQRKAKERLTLANSTLPRAHILGSLAAVRPFPDSSFLIWIQHPRKMKQGNKKNVPKYSAELQH